MYIHIFLNNESHPAGREATVLAPGPQAAPETSPPPRERERERESEREREREIKRERERVGQGDARIPCAWPEQNFWY